MNSGELRSGRSLGKEKKKRERAAVRVKQGGDDAENTFVSPVAFAGGGRAGLATLSHASAGGGVRETVGESLGGLWRLGTIRRDVAAIDSAALLTLSRVEG